MCCCCVLCVVLSRWCEREVLWKLKNKQTNSTETKKWCWLYVMKTKIFCVIQYIGDLLVGISNCCYHRAQYYETCFVCWLLQAFFGCWGGEVVKEFWVFGSRDNIIKRENLNGKQIVVVDGANWSQYLKRRKRKEDLIHLQNPATHAKGSYNFVIRNAPFVWRAMWCICFVVLSTPFLATNTLLTVTLEIMKRCSIFFQ